tara:strand:- start:2071 stop:3840 length:1770 start_codon:yes stop_codon:yes gene_type:complete
MRISKLLNKKNFLIIFFLFYGIFSHAEEKAIDIWNIEDKNNQNSSNEIKVLDVNESDNPESTNSIYDMQSTNTYNDIKLDENLKLEKINIFGLYDPEDYSLDINMWSYSDGDQLKDIFAKINKIDLSEDATEIMQISLLTNAFTPSRNISEKEFLKFKSDWLIKNSNLELIEEYLLNNQIINYHPVLTKYLVDEYLSRAEINKACEIFKKNDNPINNDYLSKFNIYCLIRLNKNDEAQIIYDLKKENGFDDKYFEDKIYYLLGYTDVTNDKISEDSILDFHLAHETNKNFTFDPKENTNKIIWKYLSSSNLLSPIDKIDISEIDKILTLEKATHNKNYPEEELFEIYKRFQFNINQLLNANISYKSLTGIEARALIYQRILLESEMVEKLKLLKILKSLFKKDNITNAFDLELKKFLEKINPVEIPDNLTSFYYTNINIKEEKKKDIKYNKDILHQSKLLNYFNGDYSKSKIEKDIDNYLKKIKKNKKYFFSKKDQIFLESLKFDGIDISKKYDDLLQSDESQIPSDIQVMINNNEKGAVLLRIAEIIGQDDLERIDDDTLYFIINTLNQLNIDLIRNRILLKVLPLKV